MAQTSESFNNNKNSGPKFALRLKANSSLVIPYKIRHRASQMCSAGKETLTTKPDGLRSASKTYMVELEN